MSEPTQIAFHEAQNIINGGIICGGGHHLNWIANRIQQAITADRAEVHDEVHEFKANLTAEIVLRDKLLGEAFTLLNEVQKTNENYDWFVRVTSLLAKIEEVGASPKKG